MTTAAPTRTARPVSVDELARAWHAIQDGQFRRRPDRQQPPRPAPPDGTTGRRWTPTGTVLPVLGCVGQAGASTLAMAVATAAAPARVIECCSATATGLATAATAELGTSERGWSLGRREQVWIARTTRAHLDADEVPAPDDPPPGAGHLTVLDVGWEPGHVLAADGWIREQVLAAQTLIAVTTATVPGLRRFETTLSMLGPSRAVVAVVGPARRRWPRILTAALGPHTRAAEQDGRLVTVPVDKALAVRGPGPAPLPASLLAAAQTLLRHTTTAELHRKGQPE